MRVPTLSPRVRLAVKSWRKRVGRSGGLRVAAAVGALSLVAVAAGAGASSAPAAATPSGIAGIVRNASTQPTVNENKLAVNVGNVVAATTDASGNSLGQGLYTQTQAAGTGSSTVTVPVGTPNPTDVTSFSRLTTSGDSIVYSINNSGNEVQQLTASGGTFTGNLPVTFTVDLKVNGQSVDPTTATSITGNVELTYNFHNHTNTVEPISFKDAAGNIQTKQKNIAVPFGVTYVGTFGDGWADVDAPWAISGFTKGQTVTGATTLMPSSTNNYSPDGSLTIKAQAQNARLPGASITIKPQSSGGTSSVAAAGSKVGTGVNTALDKALPLLMGVEQGLGDASGKLATILDKKVDPILNLLSRLRINPETVVGKIRSDGTTIAQLGDTLLGLNAAIIGAGKGLSADVEKATSASAQAAVSKTITDLAGMNAKLTSAAAGLTKTGSILTKTATYLSKDVGTTLGPILCPNGASNCTFGEAFEGISTDLLASTCTTGQATNTAVSANSNRIITSLNSVVSKAQAANKPWADDLQTLANLVQTQANTAYPTDCASRAQAIANDVNGLAASIGSVAGAVDELVPLLNSLAADTQDIVGALTQLLDAMPGLNAKVTKAVALLGPVASADKEAQTLLNEGVLQAVANITPAIERLAKIANLLGDAAIPLKERLAGLPKLISELSYGTVGSFVGDAENLSALSARLTDVANEGVETTKAVDAKFTAGEGFPYGLATGEATSTSAVYSFDVKAASTDQASTAVIAGFALLLLIAAGGSAIWLSKRH